MRKQTLERTVILCLSLLVSYLVGVAWRMEVNYFDSYSILINARILAHGTNLPYAWIRPPLLPALLIPFFLIENMTGLPEFGYTAAHLFMAGIFAVFVYMAKEFFVLFLERPWPWITAGLLSLNPVLVHQAPFIKEDLLAAFLAAAALFSFLRWKQKGGGVRLCATSSLIAFSLLARYNIAPVLFFLVVVFTLIPRQRPLPWRELWQVLVFLIIIPAGIFAGTQVFIYAALDIAPLHRAPAQAWTDLRHFFMTTRTSESPLENFGFLFYSVSWPLCLSALYGAVVALRHKARGAVFCGLWFLAVFLLQTYFFGHKEARYLMPGLIPLYFFAVLGLKSFMEIMGQKNVRGCFRAVFFIALLMIPLNNALRECAKFLDPFYAKPAAENVSLMARQVAGPGKAVYWVGEGYPLVPADYAFLPADDYGYIYHLDTNALMYYLGEKVQGFRGAFFFPSSLEAQARPRVSGQSLKRHGIFVRGVKNYVDDGDVLVVNIEPRPYTAATRPKTLDPLYIQKVRRLSFSLSKGPVGRSLVFASDAGGGAVFLSKKRNGFQLRVEGLPEGYYEPYLRVPGSKNDPSFRPFSVKDGVGQAFFAHPLPGDVGRVILLTYDLVRAYFP